MKNILWFIPIFCFSSCAVRYGAVVGAQNISYNESATIVLSSVEIEDYNSSSTGFHLGISEESKYFLTKIYYFQNSYPDKIITIDGTKYGTSLEESGIRGTVAWKLWFLQPYFSVTRYNSDYTVGRESSSESYSALGFGADIEYDFSPRVSMYLGYGQDSYDTSSTSGAGTTVGSIGHSTVSFGLRYNFSDSIGSSKK